MNETNDLENVEKEPAPGTPVNRTPMYVTAAVVGTLLIAGLGYWLLRGRDTGQPVPTPRTVSFDTDPTKAPAAGDQTLTVSPEEIEHAGLKIEAVGETLSAEAARVSSTGVVQANAYGETPVISLLSGVAKTVNVELGQNVTKGQAVAVIASDELAAVQAKYIGLQTELTAARQGYARASKLADLNPVSRAELDEATAKLKTVEAELEEHRKHHEREMKLVEIGAASREELEMAMTKMMTAEADVTLARQRHQRAIEVAELNPVSRGEFEQAAIKLRTAEVEQATAREKLMILGLSRSKVDSLRSPSQITSEITLTAPVSGTITGRSINAGEVVEPNKELMKVTNLSTVWVIGRVYEADLGKIKAGSGASVTSDAYPGRLFRGHVTYIDPNIDQQTRTVPVRIELENPGQALKIGMYVSAAFGSLGNAESTAPIISASAVQNIDSRQIVFVATDKPNVFVVRSVRLGKENNGKFVVLEGLNVGDRIVADGSFLLRAEILKQAPMQH